jgi:hypothetical protein
MEARWGFRFNYLHRKLGDRPHEITAAELYRPLVEAWSNHLMDEDLPNKHSTPNEQSQACK